MFDAFVFIEEIKDARLLITEKILGNNVKDELLAQGTFDQCYSF